jgi:hypothetical protein
MLAQSKIFPFGDNATFDLKNTKTTSTNIWRLAGCVLTKKCAGIVRFGYIFSSIVVMTPNGNI